MTTTRTFENCWKFSYVCTNHGGIVFEHRRMDNTWISEKRDRYGNRLGVSIRTNEQMRPIWNHMQCVANCDFYSMSDNSTIRMVESGNYRVACPGDIIERGGY